MTMTWRTVVHHPLRQTSRRAVVSDKFVRAREEVRSIRRIAVVSAGRINRFGPRKCLWNEQWASWAC